MLRKWVRSHENVIFTQTSATIITLADCLLMTYNAIRVYQEEMTNVAILFAAQDKLVGAVAALPHKEVSV